MEGEFGRSFESESSLYSASDRGRARDERTDERSPFRRDYARLVHSASFRRLGGKTQLFPGNKTDFVRNRLTHSLEVAQVAKSIAIHLNKVLGAETAPIDLDIVEAAALAHDIGHPPFGHSGERALAKLMKPHGGFEGNAQTLRVVTKLEKRKLRREGAKVTDAGIDNRLGLNLTYRTLASVLKYPSQLYKRPGVTKGYYAADRAIVDEITKHVFPSEKRLCRTVECNIMDMADDIAYSTYDIEDSIREGVLSKKIVKKQMNNSDTVSSILRKVREGITEYIGEGEDTDENEVKCLTMSFFSSESTFEVGAYGRSNMSNELVGQLINSVFPVDESLHRTMKISMEREALIKMLALKHLVYELVIRSNEIKAYEFRAGEIVKRVFDILIENKSDLLPADHREVMDGLNEPERIRHICDFISGMTDRTATNYYATLLTVNPVTIFQAM